MNLKFLGMYAIMYNYRYVLLLNVFLETSLLLLIKLINKIIDLNKM